MKVRQTEDIEEIKRILCDPAIYDTIDEDGCPKIEDYLPPISNEYLYIGGYVNSKIVALMIYHKYLNGNECHIQVLPSFRKEYAKRFCEQSLEYRGNSPLYAEIPDLYANVLAFALDNNFKVVGVRMNGFIKNGKTYNIKVLEYKYGIYQKAHGD